MNQSTITNLRENIKSLTTKNDFIAYISDIFSAYNDKEITDSDLDDLIITLMTEVKGFDPRLILKYATENVNDYIADYFVTATPRIERKIAMLQAKEANKNKPEEKEKSEIPPEELEHCNAIKYLAELDKDVEYFELLARMDDETYVATIKQMLICRICPHLQVEQERFNQSFRRLLHIRPELSQVVLMSKLSNGDDDEKKSLKDFMLKYKLVNSEDHFDRVLAESKLVSTNFRSRRDKKLTFGSNLINFLNYEEAMVKNGEMTSEAAKNLRDDLFLQLNTAEALNRILIVAPANIRDDVKFDIEYLKKHPSTMVIPFIGLDEEDNPEEFEMLKGLVYAYMDKHGLWDKDPTFWNRAYAKRYVVFYEE